MTQLYFRTFKNFLALSGQFFFKPILSVFSVLVTLGSYSAVFALLLYGLESVFTLFSGAAL
jgi:hypothetical protein